MRSMTGFGRADGEVAGRRSVVEVRSVNHRFLDLKLRLPGYKEETRSVPTESDQVVEVALSKAEAPGAGDAGGADSGDDKGKGKITRDKKGKDGKSGSRRHRHGASRVLGPWLRAGRFA